MTKQEFLAMSLPFKLVCQITDRGFTKLAALGAVYIDGQVSFFDTVESDHGFESVKPILRPLSDLTKEIEHNGERFVPHKKLDNRPNLVDYTIHDVKQNINKFSFELIEKLIEWHFDIAGLIEKGEAIDVNTLPENPYK